MTNISSVTILIPLAFLARSLFHLIVIYCNSQLYELLTASIPTPALLGVSLLASRRSLPADTVRVWADKWDNGLPTPHIPCPMAGPVPLEALFNHRRYFVLARLLSRLRQGFQ